MAMLQSDPVQGAPAGRPALEPPPPAAGAVPPTSRPEPRQWVMTLALMPALAVFGLWLHSARYGASYTWHPERGVSRSIASTNGMIRLNQHTNPGFDPMEFRVQRRFLGITYQLLESDDRRMRIETLVIPYWVPLLVAAIPAALVTRRRRSFDEAVGEDAG